MVLTNQHAVWRPMLISSVVSVFRLIVSPSRVLRLSQRAFLWRRRKIHHVSSSGGERPFLVCGPHCSRHKISRTRSSRRHSRGKSSAVHHVCLALVLEVGARSGCGGILGVSVRGLGSVDVFIAHLQSENLSIGRRDEILALGV